MDRPLYQLRLKFKRFVLTMNATTTKPMLHGSTNSSEPFLQEFIAESSGSFYVRVFSLALIMLASVIGNAVVCRAILSLPSRQLPFSYYLVTNLAAAEIISSFCFPFYFVYDWLDHWPFGDIGCKLVFPIHMTAMLVVTYTLAFIAAHRYRVIVTYRSHLAPLPRAKVMLVLGLLWGAALMIVLPVGVMHRDIRLTSGYHICIALLPGDTLTDAPRHTSYSIVRFIVSYVIPNLVILMSYSAVALKLKHHMAATNISSESTRQASSQDCAAVSPPVQATLPTKRTRNSQDGSSVTDLELDILRMIYVIILIFVVCYIPTQVVFIYEQIKAGLSDWPYYVIVRRYSFLLHCLPGAFHPILYGTMSKFYANAFAKLVLCK